MRKMLMLLAVLAVGCSQNNAPVKPGTVTGEVSTYAQAVTGGVGVDTSAWSFVAIGKSPVNTRSVTLSTQGSSRELVAIATMINSNITETITDSAGLTWTQIGTWTQDESAYNEGYITSTMWYALAPAQLTNDVVTAHFSQTAGAQLGVLAVSNAGTPVNFTHSSDPTFPAPAFTMNPQAGSILFGGGGDVTGDCCLAWQAMSNTTLKAGDGLYANDYGVFWTTAPVAGGSITFGTTKVISGPVYWGAIAVEIPVGTPPPPDTTPPVTSVTAPLDQATVTGTVSLTASASDDVSVTKVEFYVDGTLLTTDTTSPYAASWDSTTVANGSHVITTKAYDPSGNMGMSAPVTVTVSNCTQVCTCQ